MTYYFYSNVFSEALFSFEVNGRVIKKNPVRTTLLIIDKEILQEMISDE